MKRLSLQLLLSSFIFVATKATDVIVTTTMGPVNLVVNTTKTPTDGNAYNTVTLGGTINIGDSTTGNITLSSSVFNAAVQALSPDDYLPLVVNNAGVINAGSVTQLGSITDNIITCQSANSSGAPHIVITSATSTGGAKRNILLDAAGDISVASQSIVAPVSGVQEVLTVDTNGNLCTSDSASLIILGSDNSLGNEKNYISIDNTSNQNGITLNTSYVTASSNTIQLNAGLNKINLVFGSSSSSTYNLLGIDSDGNLKEINFDDSVVFGSLTAATSNGEAVNFGVSNGNTFALSSTENTTLATKSGYNIILNSASHINLLSADLTNGPTTTTVVALNNSNSIETTDKASKFLFGELNSSKNYITVDNSSSNPSGIIINGELKITGLPGVSALASGQTAALTIDHSGNIGIVVSDITKKENIKALEISDDFYSLQPISYSFAGRENSATEFGFSAQALRGTSCEQAIIWGANGEPVSIDYKSVFVAAISKFFETRKALFNKVQELESRLEEKDDTILSLKNEIAMLHEKSNQLRMLVEKALIKRNLIS